VVGCRAPRTASSLASTSCIRSSATGAQAPRLGPAVDRKRRDANLIAGANACRSSRQPLGRTAIVQACEVLLDAAQQGFHRFGLARRALGRGRRDAAQQTCEGQNAGARHTPRLGRAAPQRLDESRDHLDQRGLVLQVRDVAAVLHEPRFAAARDASRDGFELREGAVLVVLALQRQHRHANPRQPSAGVERFEAGRQPGVVPDPERPVDVVAVIARQARP
jgi:hypothetical protein